MKKLPLKQLRVKSFIIQQERNHQQTVKAGLLSDGPPFTSTMLTQAACDSVVCSINCVTVNSCEIKTDD